MKDVALENKLQFQSDVKKLTVGKFDNFLNYLETNPNKTLFSVVWCTDQWDLSRNTLDMAKDVE